MTLICLLLLGCGARFGGAENIRSEAGLRQAVNALREKSDIPPLSRSEILNRTAQERADRSAAAGKAESSTDPLPALIEAGAYARFALCHETQGDDFAEAARIMVTDALAKSKLLHPSLTHIGIGAAKQGEMLYLTVDLARLIPKVAPEQAFEVVRDKMDEKRIRNSLELLTLSPNLNEKAAAAAARYMSSDISSDEVLAEVQASLKSETFAFGRMTVSFQTVTEPGQIVIPERVGDPALAFAGIGIAQGNRASQDPGSVALVMILAEPQTAHNATRLGADIPAPKAQLRAKIAPDKPLSEQAWTATLTGNHRKAAKLFEAAWHKTRKASFLYEAARAHARNENFAAAEKDMRAYADLVSGDEQKKALEMAETLKRRESIFTATAAERMSVEAKRFFVMGQMLYKEAQWDGAVDAFQQAYRFSETPEIVYNIGLAHYRAGRIGDALNFFGEYQRLTPAAADVDEARQLFEIGVDLYQNGRFDAASKQFAMAYGFLPFPELVYNLGLCYKAMGDTEKAVRFFREYLEDEPPESEAKAVREIIKELSTQNKKALSVEKKK